MSSPDRRVIEHDPAARASRLSIATYLLIAYAGMVLACLPLRLGRGLASP